MVFEIEFKRPFIGRMRIKRYGRIGFIRVLKADGPIKIGNNS